MRLIASEIAQWVGGELVGNPHQEVTGVAGLREARPGDVTFLANPRYLPAAKTTRASVILVDRQCALEFPGVLVRVDSPSLAFVRVVERMSPPPLSFRPEIHPTAVIAPTARLGKDVSIQPLAVIEDGVEIGDRTVVGAGSYLGPECRVGADCLLYAHVTLRERTWLGDRVILHSGVVLGADGFGYETVEGRHQKIPQVGTVEISDDVEIGANSCVDRGRFGKTRVGCGTKIDNLVQIGHNCVVGEHCILCAGVGIAGSTVIGNHVTLAGQVGVVGHITVGDRAVLGAQAGVTKDVPADTIMLGAPATPHMEFKRTIAATNRLPQYAARLRQLEKDLAALRAERGAGDPAR